MTSRAPQYSLEFFPPRTDDGVTKLRAARAEFARLKPAFCSVTFGAGGSTREGTLETVLEIIGEGVAAAPHLSCIGGTRDGIRDVLHEYRGHGIRHLVALRGDLPSARPTSAISLRERAGSIHPRRDGRLVSRRCRRVPRVSSAVAQSR